MPTTLRRPVGLPGKEHPRRSCRLAALSGFALGDEVAQARLGFASDATPGLQPWNNLGVSDRDFAEITGRHPGFGEKSVDFFDKINMAFKGHAQMATSTIVDRSTSNIVDVPFSSLLRITKI
ncbi:MAG: hypothetical protein AAF280_14825 [Pseudomonadota bacterium]